MKKKILVVGNLGYVGAILDKILFNSNIEVYGIDPNWFLNNINRNDYVYRQWNNDFRKLLHNKEVWEIKYDAVVYLAAVSNDPMGANFAQVTREINGEFCIEAAKKCKELGIKKFIFASSCSTYGLADNNARKETDEINPITEYAKSKIFAENKLREICDENFEAICLRFATACGSSPNLRLDLVLNDFITSAHVNNTVEVLSDGTPWRPLIHVQDMGLSILWAIDYQNTNKFTVVNVGSEKFTYQIKDLAKKVVEFVPGCQLKISSDKPADSRSYKVDFSLYHKIADKKFHPKYDVNKAIEDIYSQVKTLNIEKDFRNSSKWIRLKKLQDNISKSKMNNQLFWTSNN